MSKSITVKIVNAFVTNGSGGNAAGVVLDADDLTDPEMQRIAAAVGLSETAFVSASDTEAFKLDFFTPNSRIAHCGHATVATFSYLAEIGRVAEGDTSKETIEGPRKILLQDGAAFLEQLAPQYQGESEWTGVTKAEILAALGLVEADLIADCDPVVVSTGMKFLYVGVKSSAILSEIQPNLEAVQTFTEALEGVGVYVFTTDVAKSEFAATARMFAPAFGIDEESATGMAAGPLACLLHDRLGVVTDIIVVEQGVYMTPPSPSILEARLDLADGAITGLMVGGFGAVMEDREIEY
ncbi:MAG: PhzF family phenazine biosynthesis protein [Alphaproteobacteria bacterium]|nr:PhzF family phenazine biosynthesis protein [Alphaproteobacteria bacterium]